VDEKRSALLWRKRAALHRDQLQVRDEKRAEKICRLLPYRPFGQVCDQDAAVLHREREIEARSDLAEDEPQVRRSGDLPDLIQDRRDRVGAQRLGVARKLLLPEAQRLGIADVRDDAVAEAVVGVEARQIDQSGVLARDERRDAVEKEVFEARSPAVRPEVLERRDDAGSGERAPLRRYLGRGIEADRVLGLAGVEVAHVVDPRARDGVKNVLGEVAVRIDDGDSLARIDVAHCEIEEKRALARAGFPDDPNVAFALLARKDNTTAVRGCRNWKKLCLHTVAPAPGDDALCLLQLASAVVRTSLLVEVGRTRHAERPMLRCSRRPTRNRRHALRRGRVSVL